jgi:tRNA 2-thiouridine synthesizing protein B
MILHTISAVPDSSTFRECLSIATQEDAVLLLGDGVYAALPGNPFLAGLLETGADIHVLRADALATGVVEPDTAVTLIDMAGFVELTERYPHQMAWF